MRWVMDFILGVRQIKGEMDIALSRKLELLLQNAGRGGTSSIFKRNLPYLTRPCRGRTAAYALAQGENRADLRSRLVGYHGDIGAHEGIDRSDRGA